VQSPSAPRDATAAHLAEAAGLGLYVAETALKDAEGDANKALTLLLKAVARRRAAENELGAGC
jgi:hypothetical protein